MPRNGDFPHKNDVVWNAVAGQQLAHPGVDGVEEGSQVGGGGCHGVEGGGCHGVEGGGCHGVEGGGCHGVEGGGCHGVEGGGCHGVEGGGCHGVEGGGCHGNHKKQQDQVTCNRMYLPPTKVFDVLLLNRHHGT